MIDSLHCYRNSRDVDWNTCGTAAIATIADYWGANPYGLARTTYDGGRYYWHDGEAIDATINGGWGPDVVFGWGTTGGRIAEALNSYGINAGVGYSGFASWGWQGLWQCLQDYLAWNCPVPVMLDLGAIGGPWWSVHWAIAYKIEDGRVFLGNQAGGADSEPPVSDFLRAWHCWFLPYGFNHCGVYAWA